VASGLHGRPAARHPECRIKADLGINSRVQAIHDGGADVGNRFDIAGREQAGQAQQHAPQQVAEEDVQWRQEQAHDGIDAKHMPVRGSRCPQGLAGAADSDRTMSQDLLNRIDQRTRLAGHNRLALLLFRLGGRQSFGVNVFKVQEVLRRPPLFQLPGLPAQFAGVSNVRGRSVPVLDLGRAIGHPERDLNPDAPSYLVVTEFNRSIQGFLVSEVERIVNIAVEDIHPPPELGANASHLTAVTRFQDRLIQVIDVESVMAEITQARMDMTLPAEMALPVASREQQVLVVDDSRVARHQIRNVLEQLQVNATLLSDGRQALDHLLQIHASGENPCERYAMVISDIEMPVMDGYTLTTEIRRHPTLKDLHVLLHTSLSGVFNNAMIEQVGANAFVAKYSPDDLAAHVVNRLRAVAAAE